MEPRNSGFPIPPSHLLRFYFSLASLLFCFCFDFVLLLFLFCFAFVSFLFRAKLREEGKKRLTRLTADSAADSTLKECNSKLSVGLLLQFFSYKLKHAILESLLFGLN